MTELAKGERLLAVAESEAGPLYATTFGLRLPDGGDSPMRTLGWEEIERAGWDRETELLVVVEIADVGQTRPPHRLKVTEPGRLVDVVREQVTGSVLLTRTEMVDDRHGVQVSARRRAGDGEVLWTATVDPALDLSDPAVRSRVEELIGLVQSELP